LVCDDNNVCTKDTCSAGVCVFTPIDIPASNDKCVLSLCDKNNGPYTRNVDCDDKNPCTADSCDSTNGQCVHKGKTCDDNNACTQDSCSADTGNCINTPITCTDSNACSKDTCDAVKGCVNTPKFDIKQLQTDDKCNTYVCDNSNGQLIKTAVNCNDNNPCTIDTCDAKNGCVFTPKDCAGTDLCNTGSCDAATGKCTLSSVVCNDNNACTTDSCDKTTGKCVFVPKSCDDQNACTTDSCNRDTGVCINTAKVCNDNNVCTKDSCNAQSGECIFQDISNDIISAAAANKCLTSKCDAVLGLVQTPVTCTSTDKCTQAFCDPARGCVLQPVVCSAQPGGACSKCNANTGICEAVIPNCDDKNPCTNDAYVPGVGCTNTAKCISANLCVTASCDKTSGSCAFTNKNCDDGNPCTADSCDESSGNCVNTPKACSCPSGNVAFCNATTGQCNYNPACRSTSDCQPGQVCDTQKGCYVATE